MKVYELPIIQDKSPIDITTIDTNKDGVVDIDEYIQYELDELGKADVETTKWVMGQSAFIFDVMDILFDENQSGTLNVNDFATLYRQFDSQTDGLNGEFSINDQSAFLEYVMSAIPNSEKSVMEYGEVYYKKYQLEN